MGIRDKLAALWKPCPDPGYKLPASFREQFLARYINKHAPAITEADIESAAQRLGVTPAHIRMVRKVESGGKSFDDKGRPVILFEPHVFHRRTEGQFSPAPYSYAKWNAKPYPKSFDGRWTQMADAAAMDEQAALESASWGLFQIMGYHWPELGYESAREFTVRMAASESEHLEALVRFIKRNGMAEKLRQCRRGDPASCRAFARAYNGPAFDKNRYAEKMAAAL